MMTLRESFEKWSDAPRNALLAAKSRAAVQSVLMDRWQDMELDSITVDVVRDIFSQSRALHEIKVKAASILLYLLQWGADNGYCKRPKFTLSVASTPEAVKEEKKAGTKPETVKEEKKTKENPKPEKEKKAVSESQDDKEEKRPDAAVETHDQPKQGGRSPRPFAQIDPNTLEVVKVWGTMKEAQREMGACNLDRAAKYLRKSAGFFWSDADEAATFRQRLENKVRGIATSLTPSASVVCEKPVGKKDKPSPDVKDDGKEQPAAQESADVRQEDITVDSAARTDIGQFKDSELIDELRHRGWKGEISLLVTVKL